MIFYKSWLLNSNINKALASDLPFPKWCAGEDVSQNSPLYSREFSNNRRFLVFSSTEGTRRLPLRPTPRSSPLNKHKEVISTSLCLCAGEDLNLQALRHWPLEPACLPFHHPRALLFWLNSEFLSNLPLGEIAEIIELSSSHSPFRNG